MLGPFSEIALFSDYNSVTIIVCTVKWAGSVVSLCFGNPIRHDVHHTIQFLKTGFKNTSAQRDF